MQVLPIVTGDDLCKIKLEATKITDEWDDQNEPAEPIWYASRRTSQLDELLLDPFTSHTIHNWQASSLLKIDCSSSGEVRFFKEYPYRTSSQLEAKNLQRYMICLPGLVKIISIPCPGFSNLLIENGSGGAISITHIPLATGQAKSNSVDLASVLRKEEEVFESYMEKHGVNAFVFTAAVRSTPDVPVDNESYFRATVLYLCMCMVLFTMAAVLMSRCCLKKAVVRRVLKFELLDQEAPARIFRHDKGKFEDKT